MSIEERNMHTSSRLGISFMVLLFFCFCTGVHSQNVHASTKNRLGNRRNLTLHYQSKDNDLGQQNVADEKYHFDAYSFDRDFARFQSNCSWLVAAEGMYSLNGQTGFCEFNYYWPE
ncbi:hypothetical protein SLEP1_g9333 [Rubroshorea leprosula]|uniref:S-protein homolog n=1 Tax=Rubroshorea leprosula TaxID=152421 RepID=A0AAV5I4L0_9ROSI|nr:hypothetical protein SLEP1_g9333 [Rubroshorea leprosula]